MEKLNATLIINETEKKITISGLKVELSINYSSDVDFTELTSVLATHIDEGNEIVLIINAIESDDEKLGIVLETVQEIFKKYNDSIKSEDATTSNEQEDLPF